MNEDTEFLLEKARENIKAAEILEQQGFFAIAASRIYYAMFYTAEALLHDRGLSFSKHSTVIAAYGKEFSKTGDLDPKFHQYLIKAQELRQTSDYGHHEIVEPESVKQVSAWAREFLSAAEERLSRD